MTKQTLSKFALALVVVLMSSNSTQVFAQHGGGTAPDPTGEPGNGVVQAQHGGSEPDPTGEPGNGVVQAQHGGSEPDPTGEPGNGVAVHYSL